MDEKKHTLEWAGEAEDTLTITPPDTVTQPGGISGPQVSPKDRKVWTPQLVLQLLRLGEMGS